MSRTRQFEKKWKTVYFDFETTHKDLIDHGYKNGVILYNIHHQDANGKWDNGDETDLDQVNNNITGTHVKDFWEDICELAYNGTKRLVLYAHNLFFDFNFIYKFLLRNKIVELTFDADAVDGRSGNKMYVFGTASKIYYARIAIIYKSKILIFEFRDTMKFFASSLKTLAKSTPYVKHLKGEEDIVIQTPKTRVKDYPENFVRYCKRDTWIIRYIMEQLVDAVKGLNTWKRYHEFYRRIYKKPDFELSVMNDVFTISALSYKMMKLASTLYAWEHNLKEWDEYKQLKNNEYLEKENLKPKFKVIGEFFTKIPVRDWKEYRDFFRGGYTQFSSKVENGEFEMLPENKNFSIDVNSAYPYWMTQALPYGRPYDYEPEGSNTKMLEIDIYDCKIKPKYEHLPTLYNNDRKKQEENRYIKEWKSDQAYTVKLFECEWKALQRMYDFNSYEIIKETWYKCAPYLADYYDEMYAVRKQYKKEKKDGLQLGIKTLLNAGYGALGKRLEFDKVLFLEEDPFYVVQIDEETNIPFIRVEIKGKQRELQVKLRSVEECESLTMSNKKVWKITCKDEPRDESTYYFNDVASGFITANQRSLLFNTIANLPDSATPLYCDTDSIYIGGMKDDEFDEWNKKYCDASKLGMWKVEHTNLLKFVSPKAKFYGMECDGKDCCGERQIVLKTSGLNFYMLEQQGITKEMFFKMMQDNLGYLLDPDSMYDQAEIKTIEQFLFDGLDYEFDDYGIVLVPRKLRTIKLEGVQ